MRKKYRRTTGFVIFWIFILALLGVAALVIFIYQSGFRYIKTNSGVKFFGDIDKDDVVASGRIWLESDAASIKIQKYYIVEATAGFASALPGKDAFSVFSGSAVLEEINAALPEEVTKNYPLNNFVFNNSGNGVVLRNESFDEIAHSKKLSGGDIFASNGIKWRLVKDDEIVQAENSSKKYKGDVFDFLRETDIAFASFEFADGGVFNLYPVRNIYRIAYDKGARSGELYIGEIDRDFYKNGRGLYYYASSDDLYYGDFVDDVKIGKAWIYSENGDTYSGYIEDGKKHGEGQFKWGDDGSCYSGMFADNMKNGKGVYVFADGSMYEGDYENDEKHGKGKFTWASGDIYEGDYVHDLYKGKGTYTWSTGEYYEGDFDHNTIHGWGTYHWVSGRTYEGYWDYGKMVLPDEKPGDIENHDVTEFER